MPVKNPSPPSERVRTAQPPRFIVVEGPLRVGKTTLARILSERLHARRIYDCEDNPFLADFYDEKPGAAFRAQMYFLIERQRRLREALAVDSPGQVVSDYLMEKDRIFANLNLNDEELKLYDRYYAILAADVPAPDLVIYLQASPEVLRARISKRGAKEERRIAPEYVDEVARAYEHFFFRYSASDLLVINTSEIDFVERSADLQQLLRRLKDPVRGTQYFLPLGETRE
jgi:deoxyguanosine kinase